MIPDWLVVVATGLALCATVFVKWQWAITLATPALLRFVVWPIVIDVAQRVPPILVAIAVMIAAPLLILRMVHRALSVTISRGAADHAVGGFLAKLFHRRNHRGRPENHPHSGDQR